MRSNRGRDTRPEMAIRRGLHAMGFRYFVNRRPLAHLRRTADIVFPRLRLAVFVDGCFWHGCPAHHTISRTNADYWASKVDQNRRRDAETTELLTAAGWIVVRVWEHEPSEAATLRVAETIRDIATAAPSK
ncbi:T/G mismatch-specific endonuclease [Microbacterium sp. BK668]|nr:T/G mismatch-specific endonuclease [Microbacterium sp. BK668]